MNISNSPDAADDSKLNPAFQETLKRNTDSGFGVFLFAKSVF